MRAEKLSGRERKAVLLVAFELAMSFIPFCVTALWAAQPFVEIPLKASLSGQDSYKTATERANQSPNAEEPITRANGAKAFMRSLSDGNELSDRLSGSVRNHVRQNLAEPEFTLGDDGLNELTNRYNTRRDFWRYLIRCCSRRLVMEIHKLFAPLEVGLGRLRDTARRIGGALRLLLTSPITVHSEHGQHLSS